jgi:hypothetical protein
MFRHPIPPCQRRETLAECGIEPFDVGGVDDPVTLRATPERFDVRGRAHNNATFHGDNVPLLVAFHDLRYADMTPWPRPGTPMGACPLWIAKRFVNRPDIGAQPIGIEQEGTMQRAPTHPLDELPNKQQVPMGTHGSGEPQAGTDHQR